MKTFLRFLVLASFWRIAFMLILGITGLPVRSAPMTVDNRYLLVFDTSATMKPGLPAIKNLVGQLCISMMNGDLQTGDSIGVWTFATQVSTGVLPLQVWNPADAALIASNIVTFVQDRHYSKTTNFKAVLPLLDRVVQSSDRLTVILFCDGDGQFVGTPYDAAINAVFKQYARSMQKSGRPFVVVIRSQLGEYVGCKVTLAPDRVVFPVFPRLPEAPVPLPYAPVTATPAPAPASPASLPTAPPLIIIGTKVGTNPPPDNSGPPESVPMGKRIEPATNTTVIPPAPVPAPVVTVTNVVTVTDTVTEVSPPVSVVPTNAPADLPVTTGLTSSRALAIGAGLLAAAVVLTFWMMRNLREPAQSSLITRSLDQKNNPPPKA